MSVTESGHAHAKVPAALAPVPDAAEGAAVDPALRPRRRQRNVAAFVAFVWLAAVCVLAIAADWLPLSGYERPIGTPAMAPGWRWPEMLGTDTVGRSHLSRVIYGARVSLAISVLAVALGLIVGGVLGMLAGFHRGPLERVINVMIDSLLAFPSLVFLLAVTAMFEPSFKVLVVSLGILSMPTFARLARASTLAVVRQDFVLAAKGIGDANRWIIFREVMPNVLTPVVSYAFIVTGAMMVAEGSLSFLGLGVPPPRPSWGGMIAAGRPRFETSPWLVFVPAITLFLTVFALTVVGDWARQRAEGGTSSVVSA